jgi:uncharacterized protein (TIGR03083 family)
VQETLEFPDLLRLIDERTTAFCAAVAAAPGLDEKVPTCPGWTLFDLVQHLGSGRRAWAATLALGAAATGKAAPEGPDAPRELDELLAWMKASTQQLLDALRTAGPDAPCWTWWTKSQSPGTSGAVARHQVQEIAMHTYDAQVTAGGGQPFPLELALDGVDEFLFTVTSTTIAWPHEPATIDVRADEGRSWRLRLDDDGARVARLTEPAADPADTTMHGTAEELLLDMYGRPGSSKVDGDERHLARLVDWVPE